MKVGQTFDKNRSSEAQAPYEEPYERSAFGDKIYHEPKIRESVGKAWRYTQVREKRELPSMFYAETDNL